jgi:hypothetical protein
VNKLSGRRGRGGKDSSDFAVGLEKSVLMADDVEHRIDIAIPLNSDGDARTPEVDGRIEKGYFVAIGWR